MNSGNRSAVDVWFPVFSQLLFPSVSYLLSWTRTSGHGWASDRSGPAFVWGLSHRRLQVIGSRGRPGSPQRCAWPTQTGMCVTSCLQEQGEECWECWCGSFLCWIAFFLGKSGRKAASGHFSVPVFQTIVSVLFLLVLVFILSDMRCQSKADLFCWSFNSLRCSRKMDRANPAGLFPYRKWRSLPGCCPQRNACAVRRMRQRVGVKFTTAALRVCSLNAPSASVWADPCSSSMKALFGLTVAARRAEPRGSLMMAGNTAWLSSRTDGTLMLRGARGHQEHLEVFEQETLGPSAACLRWPDLWPLLCGCMWGGVQFYPHVSPCPPPIQSETKTTKKCLCLRRADQIRHECSWWTL